MNIFTWIVLLVLLLFALQGYRRGFVKTLVSMAFIFVAIILVQFVTPYISSFLKEHTPVYDYVKEQCAQAFVQGENGEEEYEQEEASRLEQTQIIEELPLPDALKKELLQNNNKAGYERLSVETFTDYIAGYMADLIMNLITYVVSLLVVWILLRIAAMALDIISHIPILHGMNHIFGFLIGLVQGVFLVWIVFLVITMCSSTEMGRQLLAMIYESPILDGLYNANILLRWMLNFMSAL